LGGGRVSVFVEQGLFGREKFKYPGREVNKFYKGNVVDGKHYWLTPREVYEQLDAEFGFTFDPCPFPRAVGFNGLTCEWGSSSYVNPPFGTVVENGVRSGPLAWARKCIEQAGAGKVAVMVYDVDRWILEMLGAGARVIDLGELHWLSIEDGLPGRGSGRHTGAFVLDGRIW
jgi:hypothetical protein